MRRVVRSFQPEGDDAGADEAFAELRKSLESLQAVHERNNPIHSYKDEDEDQLEDSAAVAKAERENEAGDAAKEEGEDER
ncbi:hypothetical protein LTR36_000431 [Oleoguttula mirabilis]|uniref:Uncharacterized protein n=1 Tax=Oleoguttula mirabilis TaxID=1507867 RepID=A0AAV9K0E1_9PEZI|nr:hypothetical protein LTR36_000431 [Oleoguttula mirabilis]